MRTLLASWRSPNTSTASNPAASNTSVVRSDTGCFGVRGSAQSELRAFIPDAHRSCSEDLDPPPEVSPRTTEVFEAAGFDAVEVFGDLHEASSVLMRFLSAR